MCAGTRESPSSAPRFLALVREDARLLVEDKESSLALHFRRAPERERELRDLVTGAASRHDGHHVLHGKMVVEIKPVHANKGDAIVHYLKASPFAGRRQPAGLHEYEGGECSFTST